MEIPVYKTDALSKLRENRRLHVRTLNQAMVKFREQAAMQVEARLSAIRSGEPFDLDFDLPKPEDCTEEYDDAIKMFEMIVGDDIVVLAQYDFDRYVLDQWSWTSYFRTTTSRYID